MVVGAKVAENQSRKSSGVIRAETTCHHWAISTFQSLGVTFPRSGEGEFEDAP
jgi:hypothetical protein